MREKRWTKKKRDRERTKKYEIKKNTILNDVKLSMHTQHMNVPILDFNFFLFVE